MGNARTARNALFTPLHSGYTHFKPWPLFVPLALKVMDSIFVAYNCEGQGMCRNWLISWVNNTLPRTLLYCLSGHAAKGFVCSLQLSQTPPICGGFFFEGLLPWKAPGDFFSFFLFFLNASYAITFLSKPEGRTASKDECYSLYMNTPLPR